MMEICDMTMEEYKRLLFTPYSELGEAEREKLPIESQKVLSFLRRSGEGHRNFYQYTTIASLRGLLSSKRLYLTLASSLNDKVECKTSDRNLWKRSYIASFSFGQPENMAMWKMYGESETESVRIGFEGRKFVARIRELKASRKGFCKVVRNFAKPDTYEDLGTAVECVSLQDVLYQYGRVDKDHKHGSVLWNKLVANDTRCKGFDDCAKHKEFATFVKDCAWSYENEARVVVVLEKEMPDVKRIAVDITGVVKSLTVLSGPCQSKEAEIKQLLREKKYSMAALRESTLDVDLRSRRERLG